MTLKEIIDIDKHYYMNTFGERTPVCFEYGKGIKLYSNEGKEYYDFFSGIAVSSLGHGHPKLVSAITNQAAKLIHCSNLYYNEPQACLAKLLVENSCFDKVFFANSGAEANEGAIKLARAFFNKKGFGNKNEIITLKNSFHGRTLTTLTATGQPKYQKYFSPLTPGFKYAAKNDFEELQSLVTDNTCAILVEPIMGESGVYPLDYDYVKNLRSLCDDNGILLIFDEVQTGAGRSGKLFAYEHYNIEPDIMTLAKGIGGGFPISAILAKDYVASAFSPGDHGTTFGGGPLACTAALTTLNTIIEDKLIDNAAEVGEYFISSLIDFSKNKASNIKEVRGMGLMIGVEFNTDTAVSIKNALFNKGWLVGCVGNNILRILPPLIITKYEVDLFMQDFSEVV